MNHEDLWRSTGRAHESIQEECYALKEIAQSVAYLHPELATDLIYIANSIEQSRQQIQGDRAQELNLNLQQAMQSQAELLTAMLKN